MQRYITTWREPDEILKWDFHISFSRGEALETFNNLNARGALSIATNELGDDIPEMTTWLVPVGLHHRSVGCCARVQIPADAVPYRHAHVLRQCKSVTRSRRNHRWASRLRNADLVEHHRKMMMRVSRKFIDGWFQPSTYNESTWQ